MKQHIKDVLAKAVVTFLEGFGATWAITNFALNKVALVGAVAAGLSAVYNTMRKLLSANLTA